MIAALVVNGQPTDQKFLTEQLAAVDYIIAVDGGMHQLAAINVVPDVLVGDLDSYRLDAAASNAAEVVQLPVEKDQSDLEFAIDLAVQRGATMLLLYSALGNRLDHMLLNFNVLMRAKQRGVAAELRTVNQRLIVARRQQLLALDEGQIFSIIPLTNLSGVTISGAKYNLENHFIDHYSSHCLSNSAATERVSITIEQGDAFIVVLG